MVLQVSQCPGLERIYYLSFWVTGPVLSRGWLVLDVLPFMESQIKSCWIFIFIHSFLCRCLCVRAVEMWLWHGLGYTVSPICPPPPAPPKLALIPPPTSPSLQGQKCLGATGVDGGDTVFPPLTRAQTHFSHQSPAEGSASLVFTSDVLICAGGL